MPQCIDIEGLIACLEQDLEASHGVHLYLCVAILGLLLLGLRVTIALAA